MARLSEFWSFEHVKILPLIFCIDLYIVKRMNIFERNIHFPYGYVDFFTVRGFWKFKVFVLHLFGYQGSRMVY